MRFALLIGMTFLSAGSAMADDVWRRHTIDDSSRGADGVRLTDINGDGLLDITTGWEEGGIVRVYHHPGHEKARGQWPAVTVGQVAAPEDAVFADLDNDGAVDVISSCEGKTRTMFVHWAPSDAKDALSPSAWSTAAIPATQDRAQWMFCVPAQIDGKHGVDLIVGSKGKQGLIGWLQAPENPRQLDQWKLHTICPAGWIMSLIWTDIDGDGNTDILASDRRGAGRGCFWLKNPGIDGPLTEPWTKHPIGTGNREVMFLDDADVDGDGLSDVVVPNKPGQILWHRRQPGKQVAWETSQIPFPKNVGTGKSTAIADINNDGRADIVFSFENAKNVSGIVWMEQHQTDAGEITWQQHTLSGPTGTKFDLIQTSDIDGDGDLDVMTCEERENLGVIWYENPRPVGSRQ